MQLNMQEEYYSPQEIEEKLKLKRSWTYAQIRDGKLNAIRAGKYLRIALSDLEKCLQTTSSDSN